MAPTGTAPAFLSNFAERQRQLASSGPEWLRTLRHDALARFRELGLPTTRLEAWRTTNLSTVAATEFVPPAGGISDDLLSRLPAAARVDLGGPRLVFVNGSYASDLSSPPPQAAGLWYGSLPDALAALPERVRPHLTRREPAATQALDALNASFLEDGAVVLVDAKHDAGPPLQLLFVSTPSEQPTATHPRTLIVAESGSRLQVVETHVGLADDLYLTNAVTDVVAGDDTHLEHYRIQLESSKAFHLSTIHSRQTRDSRCSLFNINLGGRLVRHDVVSVLDGEGAECRLDGLALTRDEQHIDNHTVLDHARPHGSSRELYKGILDGNSRAVFNGRIIVRPDAQKTDAKQSNPNLLLSAGALANTRPQLEIYADDVKCTHGATVGRLDEEAVFYLRSRGISDLDARNLMLAAFAGEVLERIEPAPLRSELERAVAERLPRIRHRNA